MRLVIIFRSVGRCDYILQGPIAPPGGSQGSCVALDYDNALSVNSWEAVIYAIGSMCVYVCYMFLNSIFTTIYFSSAFLYLKM